MAEETKKEGGKVWGRIEVANNDVRDNVYTMPLYVNRPYFLLMRGENVKAIAGLVKHDVLIPVGGYDPSDDADDWALGGSVGNASAIDEYSFSGINGQIWAANLPAPREGMWVRMRMKRADVRRSGLANNVLAVVHYVISQ